MRYIGASILLLACFSYAVISSFTATPQARNMIATIYDDGKSCPNNCDAHVVFNPAHNGTRNAFDPASSRSAPRRCIVGQQCKICFSEDASSCMLATYRGGGPEVGRFDFTPAFYEENCPKANLPTVFARQCRSAQPAMDILKNQINCIANPEHEKCKGMMETVARRKAADDVLYGECKRLGQAAFNRKYRNQPRMQRSNDCAYERLRTGGGGRWRRLLDGACRTGNYVGRDGLDCCSGNLYAAAMLGRECRSFFVPR
jgi:hypothetical protein